MRRDEEGGNRPTWETGLHNENIEKHEIDTSVVIYIIIIIIIIIINDNLYREV